MQVFLCDEISLLKSLVGQLGWGLVVGADEISDGRRHGMIEWRETIK